MVGMRIRRPGASLVVAWAALLVASTGTAVAATPVVKRALFANNAGKLQGRATPTSIQRP